MSDKIDDSNSISSDRNEDEPGTVSDGSVKDSAISTKDEDSKNESGKDESAKDDSEKNDSDKDDSEKNDSDKDDSESESEDDKGLLDRPVEVSGCRARKKVERLDVSFATPTGSNQPIAEGKGKKLGEFPLIEKKIQKTPPTELKVLHKILFNRVGGGSEIKKNIRKFSGFPFDKKSSEYDKKKSQIDKQQVALLKQMCVILNLERSGVKGEISSRVLDFLMLPKETEKTVSKTKTKSAPKTPAGKKTKKGNEKDPEELASGDDEKSEDSEEISDSEKSDKKISKENPKKKKQAAKAPKRKHEEASESDSEKPTKKKMPSDNDIRKLVKKILAKADLHEITMKKIIKQVADAYPAIDLTEKKTFIKSTIKACIH